MNPPNATADAQRPEQAPVGFDQDGQLSDKGAAIFCPACRCELSIGLMHECQFAGCKQCGGMMFQQQTFAMLIDHLRSINPQPKRMPKPMDASQMNVKRHCPTCDASLETHPYAGPGNSVIDTCPSCHVIWFDRGELNNLVSAPGRR